MNRTTRRDRRAFTAIEVLLVTAVFAAASAGWLGHTRADDRTLEAFTEEGDLRQIARRYHVATGQCPTVPVLVGTQALPFAPLDPWGKEYWFACREGQVTVLSDGPDRRPFTGDDVGFPWAPWMAGRGGRS